MTIALTDEELALRDAVRAWATRHITPTVLRAAVDAKVDERPEFWNSLAELGVLGLHLPEEVGGAGYGMGELAVVVEEFGRALVPGPYLPTVLVAAILDESGRADLLPGLADGSILASIALQPGTLVVDRTGDTPVLEGESGYALGGHTADLYLLAARDTIGDEVFVVVPREKGIVTELPSHDVVRRNATLTAAELGLGAGDVLAIAPARVRDLAATLFAAESSGVADRAVATAADYAKVRQQFGRPIGQFQGVKHRVARMLAHVEQARVAAWDAARAVAAGAGSESSLAAAVAGAVAPEAAYTVTKDCIQTLGGIGYTWEHDAHLYLRRAQTLRILLGTTGSWRRRVADLTLSGTRRDLSIELPAEADRIRSEVRAELAETAALSGREQAVRLADLGYTAPHLPVPWGRGAGPVEQLVIAEELQGANLTPHDMIIGNWVVPTLLAHGSEEQQQRFVPSSLRGDIAWCQLFSEPGAGSDLAALATRATKVDGGWVLQGQKVWTSMARTADWGICLARTDGSVPKHKGISYFLIDIKNSPGLDIRPLREITGESLFNEVFFDDVFVPDELLVGAPGDGWKLARTTLANERVSLSAGSSIGSGGEQLLALAEDLGDALGDEQRSILGKVLCDAHTGGLMALRSTLRSLAGLQPGAESSIAKLLGVEHSQQIWELAVEWSGPASLLGDQPRDSAIQRFLSMRSYSIAGGTTDVQLNIIGERLLGLPRDPEPGR
ncbi:acyl-CoA dehydrogenase [Rhodococcus chondri]|uniref:Acyl-CoA dehydrogenase n=1 Tax=Rhodococcus chondri TaxID=3065941 RepID=A0ABU7JQQ5_9NOCA|nr:acyl-CoA dehydrogenase [Rhodococcus sp. CC-R104]MEE2032361.1 acyl-CoA dehydrogenase [Rhodococcus sp. CC-R104]